MRQYKTVNGKPMPFDSDSKAAFRISMQKTCTQFFQSNLWKCPALAYFGLMESKAGIQNVSQWDLFRQYVPCSHNENDAGLLAFIIGQAIAQCEPCPTQRVAFRHADMNDKSVTDQIFVDP